MNKTIYINGVISTWDNQNLDLAEVVESFTNYLTSKGLMFGGSIDYKDIE